jgi:hypothetical protein
MQPSAKEVFTGIYAEETWGRSLPEQGFSFFSGKGSHEKFIVAPYITAVREFLSTFPMKPSVLDVGCGDFNIGSKLRDMCSEYIACDIVDALISYNKLKYAHLDVEFMALDFIEHQLPGVEVIFARQVLQHLSNAQIIKALENFSTSCRYLIVTEHLPKGSFVPNHDKSTGAGIRPLDYGSGVVLTAPPFNLQPVSRRVLCAVPVDNGLIETTLYAL